MITRTMIRKKLIPAFIIFCGFFLISENVWSDSDRCRQGEDFTVTQRRNLHVYRTLEKARSERDERNYRRARSLGERALKIDPDSAVAKSFLKNLDDAEKRWFDFQERQKRLEEQKKEDARAQKEALKDVEREREYQEKAEIKAEREARKFAREKLVKDETPVSEMAPETFPEDASVDSPWPEPETQYISERDDPDIELAVKEKRSIVVDGDRVEYLQEEGRIIADGNVSIQYGDVLLICDRIEIDTVSRIALCQGNVRIEHPDGVLEGEVIRYDLAEELGEIVSADVKAFPWFARAEETSKVGPNEYVLRDGVFTTCDEDKPHYHLKAGEIRIFPDDKVIARNVTYHIGDVPLLWVPYYYHPIVDTKAKVQFIPGATSDWGNFVLSAWRFHLKGNTKVDGILDYRSKKGFAYGANLYYDLDDTGIEGLGRGLLRAYFIDQHGFGTYSPRAYRNEGTGQQWRNRLQWKHRLDFDDETVGIMELNKVSDQFVLKDYYYNEFAENNPVPLNYISIITSKPNYSFALEANKRLDDFYTVTQKLPEARLDVYTQRLWDTPVYYSSRTSATYFEKEFAHGSAPTERVGRAHTFQRFSYVAGMGPFSFVPYGTLYGTVYSRTRDHQKPVVRGTFGGGVETSARFNKVFDVHTRRFGLDVNGLRHIITPRADYYYTYRPNISKNALYQMDSIDSLDHRNGIELSLSNKIQTKVGEPGQVYSVDLLRSVISADYSFKEKNEGPRLSLLTSELEIRPYRWLYFDNRLEVETENYTIKRNSVEGIISPWKNFQAAMGYRYEKRPKDSRNQLTFDMSWIINPKWRLGLYERFDLESRNIEEQQLTVTRDLHCWEIDVTYKVNGSRIFSDDFTFWVALRLKAFPDLPLGLSRSYEKTPPGSLSSPSMSSMTTEF